MKSAEQKAREGNRGRRPINQGPQFEPLSDLKPPAGLNRHAKRLWRSLALEFDELKLLNRATAATFRQLCVWHGEQVEAEADLNRLRRKKVADRDLHAIEKAFARVEKCSTKYKAFMAEFGMSPRSREKISLHGQAGPGRGRRREDDGAPTGVTGDNRPPSKDAFADLLVN